MRIESEKKSVYSRGYRYLIVRDSNFTYYSDNRINFIFLARSGDGAIIQINYNYLKKENMDV